MAEIENGQVSALLTRNMARIRVYTRSGSGRRVPMVGLVPRAKLAEIREHFQRVWNETGRQKCRLTARVRRIESIEVQLDGEADPVKGRRLLLGVRVRPPSRKAQALRASLGELILEAERVLESPAQPSTTTEKETVGARP
jgi:hypothetical protein